MSRRELSHQADWTLKTLTEGGLMHFVLVDRMTSEVKHTDKSRAKGIIKNLLANGLQRD